DLYFGGIGGERLEAFGGLHAYRLDECFNVYIATQAGGASPGGFGWSASVGPWDQATNGIESLALGFTDYAGTVPLALSLVNVSGSTVESVRNGRWPRTDPTRNIVASHEAGHALLGLRHVTDAFGNPNWIY